MILKFLFFISTVLANPAEDAFRIIEGNMTWYDARDLCENQEGAKLAIFDNEAQYLQARNNSLIVLIADLAFQHVQKL